MAEGGVFLVPLAPEEGGFQKRRALGMGLSSVLRDLLARFGLDIPTLGMRAGDYRRPVDYLLKAGGEPGWLGLCGYYDEGLENLRFQLLDLAERSILEERSFDGPGYGEQDWTLPLARWLAPRLAADLREPGIPAPATAGEVLVESHAAGLEWIAGEVDDPNKKDFQSAIRQAIDCFSAHVGEAACEPRMRTICLWLAQELADYQRSRQRERPDDPHDVLGQLRHNLDPMGMQTVWELLARGIEEGADGLAFRACRGYARLALGRPNEALRDFEMIRERLPQQGWLAVARALEVKQEHLAAAQAFDEALTLTDPGEPYRELVEGRDAPAAPDAPSFRAALHFAKGRCLWQGGRFPQAEPALSESKKDPAMRLATLEVMAHLYRDWAVASRENEPARARRRLARHLDTLEELHQIEPRREDAEAALEAARLLGDRKSLERWRSRLEA